jgi:integrase
MLSLDQIAAAPECAEDLSEQERRALRLRLAAASAVLDLGTQGQASFQDLVDGMVRNYRLNGRASLRILIDRNGRDGSGITHLRAAFGHLAAIEIIPGLIAKYQDERLAAGAANATINREISCLKTMFNLALELGLLQPSSVPRFPRMLAEDNVREGFTDPATWEAVCRFMPLDLQDPLRWMFRSGWRWGAMQKLEWRAVDREHAMVRLERRSSKNRRPWRIPLEDPELVEIIERAWAHRHLGCPFVFHRDGGQLKYSMFRKCWRAATERAGVKGLLMHDSRRCVARNLIAAGVSQKVAMEITGHLTPAIFDRYAIVDDDDVRRAIRRQSEYLAEQPTRRKVTKLAAVRDQLALPLVSLERRVRCST